MSSETLQIFVRLQDQFGRKMSDRKRGVIFSDHLFETIPINYWDEVRQTGPEMKKQQGKKTQKIPFSECQLFPQIYIKSLDCGAAIQHSSRVCFQCKNHFERNLLICGKCQVERFCSEECMKLSFRKGEPHEEFCIKRKSKEGRKIREGNLRESHRAKDGELISADNMFNWIRSIKRTDVKKYRQRNGLPTQLPQDCHIDLLDACLALLKICLIDEPWHHKATFSMHTIFVRAASMVNILLGTGVEESVPEVAYTSFYTWVYYLMLNDSRNCGVVKEEAKTYPACRVVFQEERDGGELRKIGPFWSLVEDYENIWETYETELSKMKPFVIEIEDWDAVKEWRMNKDPSDLLTISSLN